MVKATSILVETTDGFIALQYRDNNPNIKAPNKYAPWGGRLEGDETPEEGALRELEEEIGIKFSKENLLKIGVYQCNKEEHLFDCELHAYLVKEVDRNSLNLMEGQGIYYLDVKGKLDHPNLAPHTRLMFEDCIVNQSGLMPSSLSAEKN